MKINALVFLAGLYCITAHGQPNCNLYKWSGDSACYRACQYYSERLDYAQGSRESQILFDSVVAVCPTFDVAYMEKAVPYLKRGDFATWRIWIDKAVALNPKEHLGYRGWCRYQFLRDYVLDDSTPPVPANDAKRSTSLSRAVTGYFQNGGQQCWILNVGSELANDVKNNLGLLDPIEGRATKVERKARAVERARQDFAAWRSTL